MAESSIQKGIRLALGRVSVLFRNNRGKAWIGKSARTNGGLVVIENPRRIEFGLCDGASDLIGWTPVVVTPEMVGKTVAVFTAIECKDGRNGPSETQSLFIRNVRNAGGFAGAAWNDEDALKIASGSK